MIFPPLYDEIKYAIIFVMFMMNVTAIINEKYLPLSYYIVLSFMPGTLFPFIANIRYELLLFLFSVILIITKQKINLLSLENPITKQCIIFFIIVFISVFQSYNLAISWDYFYRLVANRAFFFVVIVCCLNTTDDIKLLICFSLIILLWHAHLPVYNFLTGTHSFGHERIGTGVYHHIGEVIRGHVGLANRMSQSIVFVYFLFVYEEKTILKSIYLIMLGIFGLAIVASGSRGGMLGVGICVVLFWFKAKDKKLASIITVCSIIMFFAFNPQYIKWYSTILEGSGSGMSASSRISGLSHGVQMCIKRPLLGVGIGCYSTVRDAWYHWNIWAHNHYGEMIGELGLIGTYAWCFFIFTCFKAIKRIKSFADKNEGVDKFYYCIIDICWCILVLRLCVGMTTHSLMSPIWYMIAGILVVTGRSLEADYPKFKNYKI